MLKRQTPVVDFYSGGKILLTGATGFLGKALLSKLLQPIFEINCIYVLTRVKKGKDPHSRIKELFQDPIFEALHNDNPDFIKKIVCIPGDITCMKLGVSEQDYEMLTREVTHVIHSAATVRFNEKLKIALKINVSGTCDIVNLCNQCTQLKVLVYVSTAFSNNYRDVIKEELKKTPIFAENALNFMNSLSEEQMDRITPALIKPWPNTYAYTKAIAESCVKELTKDYPVVIFRPSIVVGAYKEPLPGWIDNLYGPTGILVGVGAGILRTCFANVNCTANLVPVDLTINALLCAGWETGTKPHKGNIKSTTNKRTQQPKFYNFVPSKVNYLTWGNYLDISLKYGQEFPISSSMWYYTITLTKYRILFNFYTILFHLIPGLLLDAGAILLGKSPQLIKAYKKIYIFCGILQIFAVEEWKFSRDNVTNLWHNISEEDKKIFYFNLDDLNWDECLRNGVIGIRKFLFKEDESTIPRAKKKLFFLWLLHRMLQLFLVVMFLFLLNKYVFTFKSFVVKPVMESYLMAPKIL